MLAAQARFASTSGLALAGWANASDPDACDYSTCESFSPDEVTPYVWAMGRGIAPGPARHYLQAFHAAGVDAPLETGTAQHRFGFRDAWNQGAGSGRDAYLYLDTGWSVLGLLNHCAGEALRRRFAAHPTAEAGYLTLGGKKARPLCGVDLGPRPP